ncbi:hypothetical protein HRbin19_00739 [bacterium HR19]|nr:hypothetical protein HRbin19_00739 [bacterium HR19]
MLYQDRKLSIKFFPPSILQDAKKFDIAVAYINSGGLNEIYEEIGKALESGAKIRLLTQIRDAFNDPKTLRKLLDLQHKSNGKFEIRISTLRHFHPKMYLFEGEKEKIAFIGSSNFTGEGLTEHAEMNLKLRGEERIFTKLKNLLKSIGEIR